MDGSTQQALADRTFEFPFARLDWPILTDHRTFPIESTCLSFLPHHFPLPVPWRPGKSASATRTIGMKPNPTLLSRHQQRTKHQGAPPRDKLPLIPCCAIISVCHLGPVCVTDLRPGLR